MTDFVRDRHVVITGASRGLGRALARAFHGRGARVSLLSRSATELQVLTKELGARAVGHAGDIRREADQAEALTLFRKAHGPVDILINNAGIGTYEPFLQSEAAALKTMIETNFTGLVMLTHQVSLEMTRRGSGHLVHVASDLGRRPLANMAVYAATKHAVVGFSQSLARELRGSGVKSTVVTPGIIDTGFGGNREGEREGPGALSPARVAEVILRLVDQPPEVLIDELSIHALGQDF